MEGIVASGQTAGVTAVYVYYKGGTDTNHDFSLIVCVKTGQNSQKYHKRGNRWNEISELDNVDPDGLNPDNQEANKGIHQPFLYIPHSPLLLEAQ